MSEVLTLAQQLMRIPSITPEDGGCQELLAEYLAGSGFNAQRMDFNDTANVLLKRDGSGPLLVFLGHTDVVPPGPEDAWDSPPFAPEVRQGNLYGRGACDMKAAVAAYAVAVRDFVARNPQPTRALGVLLTSDEEGSAVDGIVRVMPLLEQAGEGIELCLIGEPSASERVGDAIKVGRRGSLHGRLRVFGVQGHIAYPQNADNPIHRVLPALDTLAQTRWDEGNDDFPPSSLQISNIRGGEGVLNVIPGVCEVDFNVRYSTEQTPEALQQRIEAVFAQASLKFDIHWQISGRPFLSPANGVLRNAVDSAIVRHCGVSPEHSTAGGTSDGRHVAPYGAEVVECGLSNVTAHQVNEHIAVADLERLYAIYGDILDQLAG